MVKKTFEFSSRKVDYYFDAAFADLAKLSPKANTVILADENVFAAHRSKFKGWQLIVLKAGEQYKTQQTVDRIIEQLLDFGADRTTTLIGVGGGVVTDITGYVAGIYMRGINFGFVPSSLLAMVDASIGGKNGIDVGMYKNMVGLIRQPSFLLFDSSLLRSLPKTEWQNGFAEIIKHACIKDYGMFNRVLKPYTLSNFQKDRKLLNELISRNVFIKTKVVINDEFEQGERKLLNFGHTLGHAIENMYELSHGQAISIGMHYASLISEELTGFKQTDNVDAMLEKFGLPTRMRFDGPKAFGILKKDKKKNKDNINYILLDKIGKGVIRTMPFAQLEEIIGRHAG